MTATYYAIESSSEPEGLVRRLQDADGVADQVLQPNGYWAPTPVIVEWEHDNFAYELIKLKASEVDEVTEKLRKRWRK